MHHKRLHPQRLALTQELHTHPTYGLRPPASVTYLAFFEPALSARLGRAHVQALCDRVGVRGPEPDARVFIGSFLHFSLRWEEHSEFTSYTIVRERAEPAALFAQPAHDVVPADWLADLPGQLLSAVRVEVCAPTPEPRANADDAEGDEAVVQPHFFRASLASSLIADGEARVFTDFRIHPDGYNRMVVQNFRADELRLGRYVQRLLELEIYRQLALLSLPLARSVVPDLARIEQQLDALMQQMGASNPSLLADKTSLERLIRMSAELEHITSQSTYRFAASRAYAELVADRIGRLREQRTDGYRTLGGFIDRRFGPAMRTCRSVADRREALSRHLTRAANLLRTKQNIDIQEQNRDLLRSVDQRANLSLRLQETVEGLSVFAISYYLVGLLGYGFKALTKLGVPVVPALGQGIAVPLALAAVWWGTHRIKHRLIRAHQQTATAPKPDS